MNQYEQLCHKWQNLTITNDVMFGMVMENQRLCQALLRRALPELKIARLVQLTTQKQVTGTITARTSRFDVHVRDDQHRTFVLEMQVVNHHNLPLRMRYYQSQLDYDIIRIGDQYNKLQQYPTFVIAFCDFDYYGCGQAKYEFENRCQRAPTLIAGDGQHKIVFNARARNFHDNIGIKGFLQLMRGQVAVDDQLVRDVLNEIQRIKADPERRRTFMTYEMNLMDARMEGINEGRIEGTIKTLMKYEPNAEKVINALMTEFNLSRRQAEEYIEKYYKF